MNLETLFPLLEEFAYSGLFRNLAHPWDPLKTLGDSLKTILSEVDTPPTRGQAPVGMTLGDPADPGGHPEPGLFITRWLRLEKPMYLPDLAIWIGEGTRLEPSAVLKGPCVIGAHCDVRQGAYLRGNVLVGDGCTLGHATEIKNSILMNHTEAGHFNYIGDSILGSQVNLGAGTRLANLQFRGEEEKREGFIHTIKLPGEGGELDTGLEKLGAVIGDFSETGCNVVLSPGVVLGAHSWVYPNCTVPKGFYPPRQMISPKDLRPRQRER